MLEYEKYDTRFPEEWCQEVWTFTDIVARVKEDLEVSDLFLPDNQRWYWEGTCPYCSDGRRSFRLTSNFHFGVERCFCFSCGINAPVVEFLMSKKACTFDELMEYLATIIGREIPQKKRVREESQLLPQRFVHDVRRCSMPIELMVRTVFPDLVLSQKKRLGGELVSWGLCPFHHEKTPSFIILHDRDRFHCFGCGADGDVFGFASDAKGWSYMKTMLVCARYAGILIPWGEINKRRKQIRQYRKSFGE